MNTSAKIVSYGNNPVVECLQASRLALLHHDTGTARLSLLEAARNLYSQAGLASGLRRERQIELARQVFGQLARLPSSDWQSHVLSGASADDKSPVPLPVARLDDVAGCEAVKRIFQARFIYPMQQPQLAARYRLNDGGGVLLYGPPGTGKTMLARSLAGELGVPVHIIRPAEILAKYLGEAEKKLADVFAEARRQPAAMIFIDEIDAIAPSRDGPDGNGAMQRLLSQLLTELDGFDQPPGRLFFLGATNRPWDLDVALLRPGRFDALAYVPLPDAEARLALLQANLSGLPLAQGFDAQPLLQLTAGCSGAEVQALVAMAAEAAFLLACERGGEHPLSLADFEKAAQRVHRAATPELLARYTKFAHHAGQLPDAPPAIPPAMSVIAEADRDVLNKALSERHAEIEVPKPPEQSVILAVADPIRFVRARDLMEEIEVLPFVCYALQHAGINPVRRLCLHNNGQEESQNLMVEVALIPEDFGSSWTCNIAELKSGESWESNNIGLPLKLDRLRQVQEKEHAHIQITVRDKDEVLLARTLEVPVLAYNEWLYLPEFMELTAAFVQPNSSALLPVVQQAATRLEKLCGSRAFSGYQSGSGEHVQQMLAAIHDTLANDYPVDYINPPPSFETTGQKVRLVADTLSQRRGTCFDLAILQAALWEHVGLHPCIVLVPGHALLACWLKERQCEQPVVRLDGHNAAAVLAAINDESLLLVNSVESAARLTFAEAVHNGRNIISDALKSKGEIHLIDISAARSSVTPLP